MGQADGGRLGVTTTQEAIRQRRRLVQVKQRACGGKEKDGGSQRSSKGGKGAAAELAEEAARCRWRQVMDRLVIWPCKARGADVDVDVAVAGGEAGVEVRHPQARLSLSLPAAGCRRSLKMARLVMRLRKANRADVAAAVGEAEVKVSSDDEEGIVGQQGQARPAKKKPVNRPAELGPGLFDRRSTFLSPFTADDGGHQPKAHVVSVSRAHNSWVTCCSWPRVLHADADLADSMRCRFVVTAGHDGAVTAWRFDVERGTAPSGDGGGHAPSLLSPVHTCLPPNGHSVSALSCRLLMSCFLPGNREGMARKHDKPQCELVVGAGTVSGNVHACRVYASAALQIGRRGADHCAVSVSQAHRCKAVTGVDVHPLTGDLVSCDTSAIKHWEWTWKGDQASLSEVAAAGQMPTAGHCFGVALSANGLHCASVQTFSVGDPNSTATLYTKKSLAGSVVLTQMPQARRGRETTHMIPADRVAARLMNRSGPLNVSSLWDVLHAAGAWQRSLREYHGHERKQTLKERPDMREPHLPKLELGAAKHSDEAVKLQNWWPVVEALVDVLEAGYRQATATATTRGDTADLQALGLQGLNGLQAATALRRLALRTIKTATAHDIMEQNLAAAEKAPACLYCGLLLCGGLPTWMFQMDGL
eukprot:jgi/Tetstr1/436903/TSEL_025676.t2